MSSSPLDVYETASSRRNGLTTHRSTPIHLDGPKWSVHLDHATLAGSSRRLGPRRLENLMRFTRLILAALPFVALVSLASHLAAQDTRTVTEPKIPPACVTLEADIASSHGNIALTDEQKLSTARIQDAMDHCAQGQAVVLRAHGKRNVLLTGPLTLRPG